MNDYYLKFPDQATQLTFYDPANDLLIDGFSVDVIGVLYEPSGDTVTTPDGDECAEMQAIDGWHVNLRALDAELPAELIEYQIFPVSPSRTFF